MLPEAGYLDVVVNAIRGLLAMGRTVTGAWIFADELPRCTSCRTWSKSSGGA
jgi:hypothetical protein